MAGKLCSFAKSVARGKGGGKARWVRGEVVKGGDGLQGSGGRSVRRSGVQRHGSKYLFVWKRIFWLLKAFEGFFTKGSLSYLSSPCFSKNVLYNQELGLCIEFGPVRVDSVRRGVGPPPPASLDQIPPAPGHAVMDFYQGYL